MGGLQVMLLNLRGGQKRYERAVLINAAHEVKPVIWTRPAILPFPAGKEKTVSSRNILYLNATRRLVTIEGLSKTPPKPFGSGNFYKCCTSNDIISGWTLNQANIFYLTPTNSNTDQHL